MKKLITSPAVRQVLTDYWGEYRKYGWWTFIAFFAPAVGTICVFFIPPLIVARLVNIYVSAKGITFAVAGPYIVLFGAVWFLGEIFWRIGNHYSFKFKEQTLKNLNRLALLRLSERDYSFYTDNFVGSLSKKAMAFVRSFEIFTDTLSFRVVINVFPILFAIVILWLYSPWIPIILVGCLCLVVAIALPIIRRRSVMVAERHEAGSRVVGRLSDALTNMLAVKAFAKEELENSTYDEYVVDWTTKWRKAADYSNLQLNAWLSPLYVGANVIGLILSIFFAQKLNLPAGALLVIFSYYAQVTRIFWEINGTYREIESSIGEAAEFTGLFLTPPAVRDAPEASTLNVHLGQIEFHGAHFDYRKGDGEDNFLENFNLVINGNQKVGLVGPSGGGKTTITKLLLRFLDLQSGSITIDGQDISRVTQRSLREAIAYVPQEPLLFHRSLFENIAYGDESATLEDVVGAAKIAHADEFIERLPDGYQTLVGERGIKLSGGQRQRVAIARALLKKSSILILDEATSSLDSESEKYIQAGLRELMKNKTALVIAHRLSTIKNLDRIIVLDEGKIVEDGSHDELIKQKGLYAKLWSHQSGEFL